MIVTTYLAWLGFKARRAAAAGRRLIMPLRRQAMRASCGCSIADSSYWAFVEPAASGVASL